MEHVLKGKLTSVTVDSETWYTGSPQPKTKEETIDKAVRRAIGLPITKQLVFYESIRDAGSAVNIVKYRVFESYHISDSWYGIEVITANDHIHRIHSWHLIEMEKPSFIDDMRRMEENPEEEES